VKLFHMPYMLLSASHHRHDCHIFLQLGKGKRLDDQINHTQKINSNKTCLCACQKKKKKMPTLPFFKRGIMHPISPKRQKERN
jgi:hypothetical protein